MYFIGSGALLNHAVAYCLSLGLKVDGASCMPGDSAIARLRTLQIPVDECIDPNAHVSMITSTCTDGVIFSINNPRRIDDGLLVAGPLFFNVHNGLVQRYRGIAEICIFAAICRGENIYGVTLQQLKPAHKIDTGPVISQIEFAIGPQDRFADVLKTSLQACRQIFESSVLKIIHGDYQAMAIDTAVSAWSYSDLESLLSNTDTERLTRACDLGQYAGFFPRLRAATRQKKN